MPIFVAAIADDDTGATDLAGMLTDQGMRVVVVLDDTSPEQLQRWSADCEAVVLGTASRSIRKDDAYARTVAAVKLLQHLQPQRLAIKYCSTFDSTVEGNIGSAIDAAMDVTGERFTIALPALPTLGRTTYMGYHFVHQQLLSDSVLKHHPLNPMTNPHLPSHLRTQTRRSVGLLPYPEAHHGVQALQAGLRSLEEDGTEIALLDCIDEGHLQLIARAVHHLPLLTGSSAWATVLPQIWREQGLWQIAEPSSLVREAGGYGFLIVSGSCSAATRAQDEWAAAQGFLTIDLDALVLAQTGVTADDVIAQAAEALLSGETCLVTTTRRSTKENVHRWAMSNDLSVVEAGERIGHALARAVEQLLFRVMPQGLIIAGGETASTLTRALGLGGLRIGPTIEPGVPIAGALARPQLALALKSGNFGSPDFYGRAIAAMKQMSTHPESESKENR